MLKEPEARFNIESEQALIGSAVLHAKAADLMLRRMTSEMFFLPAHQKIFEVLKTIRESGGEPDMVSVKHQLIHRNELDKCGGIEYLIGCCESVGSPGNVGYYADLVCRDWQFRELTKRAMSIIKKSAGGKWEECLEDSLRILHGITDDGTFEFDASELVDMVKTPPPPGIPTTFERLNEASRTGGWPKSELSLIGAPTGVGKTWAMCQEAANACKLGLRVIVISLEQSAEEIIGRIAKQETGFDNRDDAYAHSEDEGKKFEAFQADVRLGWDLTIYDTSLLAESDNYVETVVSWIAAKHKISPVDMVLVDYGQLLTSKGFGKDFELQKRVSQTLRGTSKRLKIAIVALVQVDIDEKNRRELTTSGSKAWTKDSAMSVWLWIATKGEGENTVETMWLGLKKLRHSSGKRGGFKFKIEMDNRARIVPVVEDPYADDVYRGGE